MKNYYEILGVQPGSSTSQIKKAFRRKAKAFHPDLSRTAGNEHMMRLLLTAYEVLSDPLRRQQYDLLNKKSIYDYTFNYREYLKRKGADSESLAKLIFFDLLHNYEDEALLLFERLDDSGSFQLSRHLEREDYMDCAFLLSEEFEKRGEYLRAFELLRDIAEREYEQPYFRHFFREVIDRLRVLSCFKMPGAVENDVLISCLEELVAFNFSAKDSAFFLKKIAEIYAEENSLERAVDYLNRGLKLHSKLPGVKKLKDRLACVYPTGVS